MGLILLAWNDQGWHFKTKPHKVVMKNIQVTHPIQFVHLNYLTIEVTKGGKDVHMLIITYHFMWYTQALVTSLQTAKCRPKLCGINS